MNRLWLAGTVVASAVVGGLGMFAIDRAAPGDLGNADKTRVERVVHDYVLANPEIIPQAIQQLEDRRTGKLIAENRSAIVEPFGNAFAGNPKGDVTLVEYFDYNCGFCRASLPMIAKLIDQDPKLRVVYRDMPVLSETSLSAARLSLAAAEQGKFRAFHDALYAGGQVSEATMNAAARKAGIDTGRAAASASRIDNEIAANLSLARKLGMTGTPGWVIGDRVLAGALPIEEFEKAIAAARGG